MRFVNVQGFCIRPDRQVEFQQWIIANEERIRSSYPPGSEYGGIYAAVFSSEKHAGEFFWLDILDSYGAMDRGAALAKDPDSEYARLGEEFLQFVDTDRAAGSSQMLLKAVVDATIFNVPTG